MHTDVWNVSSTEPDSSQKDLISSNSNLSGITTLNVQIDPNPSVSEKVLMDAVAERKTMDRADVSTYEYLHWFVKSCIDQMTCNHCNIIWSIRRTWRKKRRENTLINVNTVRKLSVNRAISSDTFARIRANDHINASTAARASRSSALWIRIWWFTRVRRRSAATSAAACSLRRAV